jgi:hypothetical protein
MDMTKISFPRLASLGLAGVIACSFLGSGGCNAKVSTVLGENVDGGGPSQDGVANNQVVDGGATAGLLDEDRPLVPASKVDLLFVVDNSAGMSEKSAALAASAGTLIRNLATGHDLHLGVITTSLGSFGGDVCPSDSPATSKYDTKAHLQLFPGSDTGVLSYSGGSVDSFVATAQAMISSVGATGCGLEAQLESMYRFLIQPDPWDNVTVDGNGQASLGDGVDMTLIAQRKAFLRPDSAVVVVMLTDEDDSSADPLAVGGQAWAFENKTFPGSMVHRAATNAGTTAPRGTSACDADPGSNACQSCGLNLPETVNDKNCTTSGEPGHSGPGYDGYYAADSDDLNVRFFHMKQRYGLDPQYPIARYVDGLTKSVVPNRNSEHPSTTTNQGRRDIAAYTGVPNCISPLFAAELPGSEATTPAELCNLTRGPRSKELVTFAILGGVPKELTMASLDFVKMLGQDPDHYDFAGIDPHMIQSTEPRTGLPGPNGDATDPIHGREYNTFKYDLQYACTYALAAPKDCSSSADASCDCTPDSTVNPPICGANYQQVRGKAYPTIRPLRVAKGLGNRGFIRSICASDYTDAMTDLGQAVAPLLTK